MFTDLQASLDAIGDGRRSHYVTLQEVKALSGGQVPTGNAIIQGDNSRALELLMPRYKQKVRCAYIDPPYNNQERYTHYTDMQSHDEWLRFGNDCRCRS